MTHFILKVLAGKGATVTFLLRSLSTLESDDQIQPFLRSQKARFIAGDALNQEDVKHGWEAAQNMVPSGQIDLVLFTVGLSGLLSLQYLSLTSVPCLTGAIPDFHLLKGFQLPTPNLCTRSFLNVLLALKASISSPSHPSEPTKPQPKIVVLSSIGITRESHAKIPLLLKPMYGHLLHGPHTDKLGFERIFAYSAGWEWSDRDKPEPHILPEDWTSEFRGIGGDDDEGIESGWLKHLVVVRPALLTNGACRADNPKLGKKKPYRTIEGDLGNGYTISREDVAHFIVEGILPHWGEYENKGFEIAY